MGWADKYKYDCEHEFEKGESVDYYASTRIGDSFVEVTCTKCGYKTQIRDIYVDTFIDSYKPKDTPNPEITIKHREPEPPVDVFKEIYARTPPIPDSAINYVDDEPYVNTDYATIIVEQAILNNSSLSRSLHYSLSTYVSLYDLREILGFIDNL